MSTGAAPHEDPNLLSETIGDIAAPYSRPLVDSCLGQMITRSWLLEEAETKVANLNLERVDACTMIFDSILAVILTGTRSFSAPVFYSC